MTWAGGSTVIPSIGVEGEEGEDMHDERLGACSKGPMLLVGVVIAVVVLVASACGGSSSGGSGGSPGQTSGPDVVQQASGAAQPGGKLIYGLEAETSGFDPSSDRWAISGNMVAYAVFDPLAAYDADGVIQPYLAQSFEPSADFSSWIINLRPGVTFHDGSALDAAAVVGSLSAIKDSLLAGPAVSNVEAITATGPLAVTVTMKAPWASFPAALTGQAGVVVAPAQVALPSDAAAKKDRPIGTGPFMMQSWERDNAIRLVRNPNYWMTDAAGVQLPYLDEVEFRPIPDNQRRVDALTTGDINQMQTSDPLAAIKVNDLAASGRVQVMEDRGENEESFVMLNTSAAPFDNVLARQAMAYATNDELLLDILQVPPELATNTAFGQDSPYHFDSAFPTFDAARATDLVQQYEAATGQPLAFKLQTTTVAENQQTIEALQAMYEAVGMQVELATVPQDTFVFDAVQGKYQANLWRQFGQHDPDADYQWWHKSNATGGLTLNIARFADDQISAALDAARATDDPAVRKAQYQIVQERWASEVPYVWLYTTRWVTGAANEVRNLSSVALPDPESVADIPSLPFQMGSSRLTMTWMEQ